MTTAANWTIAPTLNASDTARLNRAWSSAAARGATQRLQSLREITEALWPMAVRLTPSQVSRVKREGFSPVEVSGVLYFPHRDEARELADYLEALAEEAEETAGRMASWGPEIVQGYGVAARSHRDAAGRLRKEASKAKEAEGAFWAA